MKHSLSGSTYIFLIAKSSIDTKTCPQLSNTPGEYCIAGSAINGWPKMHSIQNGSCFLYFLKIHDKLAGKNIFVNNIVIYTGSS